MRRTNPVRFVEKSHSKMYLINIREIKLISNPIIAVVENRSE